MDKQSIEIKMQEYGFLFNMESRKDGNITALHFMSEPSAVQPQYGCTIYPETYEFEFTYSIPGGIRLSTPKCSPFQNEDHFDKICARFESAVRALHAEFNQ